MLHARSVRLLQLVSRDCDGTSAAACLNDLMAPTAAALVAAGGGDGGYCSHCDDRHLRSRIEAAAAADGAEESLEARDGVKSFYVDFPVPTPEWN